MMVRESVHLAVLSIVALALSPPAAMADNEKQTFRFDAVELIAGRTVEGDAAHSVRHGPHVYWFANTDNKAAFERAPEKYEIQFGGACARMGPLSGACGCDLFAVHGGKLYVFASAQCREAFLRAPQTLLEADDAPPPADAEATARGRELIELAVTFAGGAAKIDAIRGYRQRIETTSEHQGKPVKETSTFIVAFPDRFRFEDTWGDSMWGHATVGDTGFFVGSDADRGPLVVSQVRAARRVADRNLLVILRARKQPGFTAAATSGGIVNGTPIERVAVAFDGTTTTLGIDPASGKVLTMSFPSRGPRLAIGLIEKTITEHKAIDGVTLPWRWTSMFDGDKEGARATTLTALEIDPKLDEQLFAPGRDK